MSWQSTVVEAVLRAQQARSPFRSPARLRARVEELALRPEPYAPPHAVTRACAATVRRVQGMPVYTLAPRTPASGRRVLYLHGGAYVTEISSSHWRLLADLVGATDATVEVPIFPLAPGATAAATVAAMTDLAAAMLKETGPAKVTIMGDSAGGGMALAVAQQLRDSQSAQPGRLVLISPWLDARVADPAQRQIERRDRMLHIAGLAEAGRLYAGDLDVTDPRVSPLLGDLGGLAPIHVFAGADDILVVDARALAARAPKAGTTVTLHEMPGMQHVYALMPLLPEARRARDAIAAIVRGRQPPGPPPDGGAAAT